MAATTTRKEALERLGKVFHDALERMIPADENQRLPGDTFRDFEIQAQAFKAALIPTLLEERARLADSAELEEAGCCPHCGSRKTRWTTEPLQKEVRGPDGVIVLTKQHARCRSCDRSFSPSGS